MHHSYRCSANLAIFNCLRTEQPRKIYSFKEIYGSIFCIKFIFFLVTFLISQLVVSVGQAAYNTRRYMLAALSLGGEIDYHLFTIDFKKCKNNYDINLMKKSEWRPSYDRYSCRPSDSNVCFFVFVFWSLHIKSPAYSFSFLFRRLLTNCFQ